MGGRWLTSFCYKCGSSAFHTSTPRPLAVSSITSSGQNLSKTLERSWNCSWSAVSLMYWWRVPATFSTIPSPRFLGLGFGDVNLFDRQTRPKTPVKTLGEEAEVCLADILRLVSGTLDETSTKRGLQRQFYVNECAYSMVGPRVIQSYCHVFKVR